MSEKRTEAAPRNVLLFSGHMIDRPGRLQPRFPAEMESVVTDKISKALAEIDAGAEDLAVCGGACGGDLLFAEACLARGTKLELYIPFDVRTFLSKSVNYAGANWHDRFLSARSSARLHVLPYELGPMLSRENPYERNNRWMLESATRFGSDRLFFICLWNGEDADGPGGTRHILEEARHKTDRLIWLKIPEVGD
jgi:hypothetical protein